MAYRPYTLAADGLAILDPCNNGQAAYWLSPWVKRGPGGAIHYRRADGGLGTVRCFDDDEEARTWLRSMCAWLSGLACGDLIGGVAPALGFKAMGRDPATAVATADWTREQWAAFDRLHYLLVGFKMLMDATRADDPGPLARFASIHMAAAFQIV